MTTTRAWTVRGGRDGEQEQAALDEDVILVAWDELGDLSGTQSVDDIVAMLRVAYPDNSEATNSNNAHQLWRFVHTMQPGDFVVMPRKNKPVLAVGRITGPYDFRADKPSLSRHARPVEWLSKGLERTAVRGDLRDSMGSLLTISELSRRGAVVRVESLATTGEDPGYDGHVEPPESLEALKKEVEESGTRQLSVRDLIGLWGWKRRTTEVIELVDRKLADSGLTVEPHFVDVPLDDLVTVTAAGGARDEPRETSVPEAQAGRDLTWRVSNVAQAGVVTVGLEDTLERAFGLMVANEFSQLPALDGAGRLKGVITWESIARAKVVRQPKIVSDALHDALNTAREDEELFGRIDGIKKHGYLLIIDDDHTVRGIVTAADLSVELRDRVEPFTVLEEIERRLRRLFRSVPLGDIKAVNPRSGRIDSVEKLTLGEYRHIAKHDDIWTKLDWPYDKGDMVERLARVAQFRNSVAHWSVDAPGRDSDELPEAKQLLNMLKELDRD